MDLRPRSPAEMAREEVIIAKKKQNLSDKERREAAAKKGVH